ncbi:U-box domain-containing protein 44-like isoform X2 [Phalaenopsis equestris]|uniref:U-box domain-containing protein 44-like isoform X2 n=1 Tax=Phalaenopsis equestris TaxID=78828 RepID=UPI0009E4DB31|nr:U-box domain-containing protein 44-like isoform X2 [Phalaenopsis equestris]
MEFDSSATASASSRGSTEEDFPSPRSSFLCSVDGELLVDPVSVSCGHSFERKAVEEHLRLGNYWCPECSKELSPTEKLTPNVSLRFYILEKKQRDAVKKLRLADSLLSSTDLECVNRALEDLKDAMMEIPSCIAKAKEDKVLRYLALLLKKSLGDTRAVLSCLLLIARFSDESKETMGTTGVIRCLTKLLRGAEPEIYALEILLELSKKDTIADKIGNDPNSIPTLVSLLNYPTAEIAEMARGVLENLYRVQFAIMMGKCGYLSPFLEHFCQENSVETRASMADELARMKLTETAARSLGNDQFVTSLTELLNSGSVSSRSSSLQCIKQLMAFREFQSRFLSNEFAIPALIGLITVAPDQLLMQEVVEIIVALIQISQHKDHQNNPGLQVLYSSNTIKSFLLQIETSGYQGQISLLKLLQIIVQKSDTARQWIKSKLGSMNFLFSALKLDQNDGVRLQVLKLIYYIAGTDINDMIFLPPSPAKDSFVNYLIAILTHSSVEEERSAAAGIIGYLLISDHSIGEMLQNTSFLKAINDIFSHSIKSNELLENSLTALHRYIVISNSVTGRQLNKLHQLLVQMLSNGASTLAKQHAAITISYLARCSRIPSTPVNSSSSFAQLRQRIPNLIQSSKRTLCSVHLSSSLQNPFCLIKAGAVKPLIEMVRTMEPGASAAALMALNTLCTQCDSTAAANAIVESQGAVAIIEALERGSMSVKEAALELLEKVCEYPRIKADGLDDKFEKVLVYLLSQENRIKFKAASVRAKLVSIPDET